jgi:hypothetical protein
MDYLISGSQGHYSLTPRIVNKYLYIETKLLFVQSAGIEAFSVTPCLLTGQCHPSVVRLITGYVRKIGREDIGKWATAPLVPLQR